MSTSITIESIVIGATYALLGYVTTWNAVKAWYGDLGTAPGRQAGLKPETSNCFVREIKDHMHSQRSNGCCQSRVLLNNPGQDHDVLSNVNDLGYREPDGDVLSELPTSSVELLRRAFVSCQALHWSAFRTAFVASITDRRYIALILFRSTRRGTGITSPCNPQAVRRIHIQEFDGSELHTCSDHEQVIAAFQQKKKDEQQAINQYQKELEKGKQVVLNERALNRFETNKLRGNRSDLDVKRAKVNRDRDIALRHMQELQAREEESKRNRYVYNTTTS